MRHPTHRLLLPAVVAGTAVAGLIDAVTGSCAGLAHLLPFMLVLIPLLAGRYIGERRLAQFAARLFSRPRRRRARLVLSRQAAGALPRGGCLIATFLAVRPPPRCSVL